MRSQRKNSTERETRIGLRNMSQSTVLENAGCAKGTTVTKSDRYLAIRLNREFDSVLDSLNIRDGQ